MPGKISEMAVQTAAGVALTDDIETRDVSDTSMAPTGTNKNMTWQEVINFLAANLPPPAGTNEVFVGPTDPGVGAGYEVWFDSDAVASSVIETAADGALQLVAQAGPITAPVAPKIKLVNLKIGNAGLPAFILPTGRMMLVAPAGWQHGSAMPNYNSTGLSTAGMAGPTATGTATAANVSTTSAITRARRVDYLVTTPSATAVAGLRYSSSILAFMGDGVGMGGFLMSARWGPATGVTGISTHRAFVGMSDQNLAGTDVDTSTLTNMFGMGWDAADTNIQFMSNDASGTATKVNLGASWPKPTADYSAMYELILYQPFASTEVNWLIINLVTGAMVDGVVTTDLPLPLVGLYPREYCSVGGTSSVVGLTTFGLDFWGCL